MVKEPPTASLIRQTRKSRLLRLEDWETVFNAVVRMRPREIAVGDTIDPIDEIRVAIRRAKERVEKGDYDDEPDSFKGDVA